MRWKMEHDVKHIYFGNASSCWLRPGAVGLVVVTGKRGGKNIEPRHDERSIF